MITMTIAMMMSLSSGTKVIKNARPRKHKLKRNSYPLPGIPQDGGIGVFQKTKKQKQKNCGNKQDLFVSFDQIQNIFDLKKTINKDVFLVECF